MGDVLQTSNDVQSSIPSLPLSHDDRVLAQLTDGKWYAGNIHGDYPHGSTPHTFLQSSGDSYCDTRVIHDTKVRDLQRKIDEEAVRSASLDTEVQSFRGPTVLIGCRELRAQCRKVRARHDATTQQHSNAVTQQHSRAVTQHSKAT